MYFITCFSDCESEYDMDSRTFGYFAELSECYRALHENQCDMYEFCYEQAVIECIGEGIHAHAEEIEWFAWDEKRGGFYEVAKPEWSIGWCNHALG